MEIIFNRLSTKTKVILAIQSISMLGGASTHLMWLINNGFLSEKYDAPFFSMVFWDSLTFLDPLAAILLIAKPKIGVWLTTTIIVVDVFHNSVLLPLLTSGDIFPLNWMTISQDAFLLFVLLTFKSNMREINLRTCTQANGMKIKDQIKGTTAGV